MGGGLQMEGRILGGKSQGSESQCIREIISIDMKIPKSDFGSEDVHVGRDGNIDRST